MERYNPKKHRHGGSRPEDAKPKGKHGGARFGNPNGTRGKHDGQRGALPGAVSKDLKEFRAHYKRSGELPHEFMLRVMRAKIGETIAGHKVTWEDRKWAAEKCANYFAPKLTSTRIEANHSHAVRPLSDEEAMAKLDKQLESFTKAAAVSTVH